MLKTDGLGALGLRAHGLRRMDQKAILSEIQCPLVVSQYPFVVIQYPFVLSQHPFVLSQHPFVVSQYPFVVSQYPFVLSQYPFVVSQYPFVVSLSNHERILLLRASHTSSSHTDTRYQPLLRESETCQFFLLFLQHEVAGFHGRIYRFLHANLVQPAFVQLVPHRHYPFNRKE